MKPAKWYRIDTDERTGIDSLAVLEGFENEAGDFYTIGERRHEYLAGPTTFVLNKLGLTKSYHKTPAGAWIAKWNAVSAQIKAREDALQKEKRRASRLSQAAFDAIPVTGNGNEVNR